jgi:hypothetical protein
MMPTTRKLHEWIGFAIGVIFVVWLVSGVVMMFPQGNRAPYEGPYGPIDFTAAVVTPEEAVRIASGAAESAPLPAARGIRFGRIEDRLVYKVGVGEEALRMVDARTGDIVTITKERAERMARAEFATDADIVDLRFTEDRDPWYQHAPLPVWRIEFDDARRSISYVATIDGSIRRSDRITRLKGAIVGTHTFDTLGIAGLLGLKVPLLVLASIIGLLSVVTGYYLSVTMFARKRRAQRARETSTEPSA